MTPVNFTTDFNEGALYIQGMNGLSIEAINPQIGDEVMIYHDAEIELWGRVLERKWVLTNKSSPILEVNLGYPRKTVRVGHQFK